MAGETYCPLCLCTAIKSYHRDTWRQYLQCTQCELVFVAREHLLSREQERAEYDLHENHPDDPGYQHFLSRLAAPLRERIAAGSCGLDFGCGSGPALAKMLREDGYDVALYDSFYVPDESVFSSRYDFICATEVVEHLHRPGAELDRLWSLLVPGGWLGVMTKLVQGPEAFRNWHYIRDRTHVCFFSESSWRWWAHRQGASLEFVGDDVILIQRI
jgi:hypothetical protein